MFYRIKLRAKLIIENKKNKVFGYVLWSLFVQLFFSVSFLISAASAVLLIFLTDAEDFLKDYMMYIPVLAALIFIAFISVYFVSLFKLLREIYFAKTIKTERYFPPVFSFVTEMKTCFKLMGQMIVLFACKLFWLVFYLSPSLALGSYLFYSIKLEKLPLNVFHILAAAVFVISAFGVFFAFCTNQRYSLVKNLICIHRKGVFEAVRESVERTDGNASSIAFFKLSFLPWYLVCPLIIPLFFVVPYYYVTYQLICEKNIQNNGNEKKKLKETLGSTKRLPNLRV